MIRWRYLLPRVGILLIAVLVTAIFSSPLMHWLVVRAAQSVTGAKVDIGAVEASPWTGRVLLKELQIADPAQPMRNLIQADVAELKLDPMRLLHRRWVIEKARLEHVQFRTPRTESGSLSEPQSSSNGSGASPISRMTRQLGVLTLDWLHQLGGQVPSLAENNLETVRFANELRRRWPQEFERQRANATALKSRAAALGQTLSQGMSNPLRELERFQSALQDVQELHGDVELAKSELHRLSRQFQQDRENLIAAKQRDQSRLRAAARDLSLDGQQLSDLLLGEQKAAQVSELVSWIRWFRQVVPDPETDFQPVRGRGSDVPFRRYPTFVFRHMELTGEGRIAGQHVHFAGAVANLSTEPKLHDLPTSFELRGQGKAHVLVSASVDRRGPKKIDEITISCPKLKVENLVLGSPQSIAIEVQPSLIGFEVASRIVDEKIDGHIKLNYSDVQMRVQRLHQLAGGEEIASAMNDRLREIEHFDVALNLRGTLEKPEIGLSTDLGDQVARIMTDSLQQAAARTVESNMAKLQTILNEQLRDLDQLVSTNLGSILGILTEEIPTVADLRNLSPSRHLNLDRLH